MVRVFKFQIKEVEGLCYLCSENKGNDQLHGYFVFAYAKSRFSHDPAHLLYFQLTVLVAQKLMLKENASPVHKALTEIKI